MADIDVVPKRRTSWIWVVMALIVLALIVWALAGVNTTDTGVDSPAGVPQGRISGESSPG